jgi:two-component system, NarL family, sensor kinase
MPPPSLTTQLQHPIATPRKVRWLITGLFIVVAVLEYTTPPPFVFGYLYVGAVLLASARLNRQATIWVAGISVALTLLNLIFPGVRPITAITVVNRIITVLALVVTAWLSEQLRLYSKAVSQQRTQIIAQEQLARVREDFVSTLTHDLKTPMLGAIETLKAFQAEKFGAVTLAQRKVINIMIRSHQTTLQLVETLLDVYRNDAEGLKLHYQKLDLFTLAEEAITSLTQLASTRQIHIRLRSGASDFRQPAWVNADPLQLSRVFYNLIANAINHSLRGRRVEVAITLKHNHHVVQIMDEGQGIQEDELLHLFDRFYQGQSDRQAKGTGLGLYLSRQIIEAHGGKIWAEQRSPRGAIFAFQLPAVMDETAHLSVRSNIVKRQNQ